MTEQTSGAQRPSLMSTAMGLVVAMIALFPAASPQAGELGHFGPALADVRDYLMPPPGFYFKQYDYFYTTHTFKNGNGDEVTSIPAPGGRSADLNTDVNIFALAPAFIGVADWDILGGHYGAYIIPTFGNSAIGASVETDIGLGRSINTSSFGVGDLLVQPLWLGWSLTHWDFALGFGFYAPTGRFEAGATDNIGLGFWTEQFQAAVAWYPEPERTTALVGVVTYEINQKSEGEDITPGQRLTVNLGVSHYVPLGSSGFLLELAALAYGQWQITDDTGSDVSNHVHDRIFGVGPQVGLTYVPWKAAATFKWVHELGAEDRFQGNNFTMNFAVAF